MGIEPNTVSTGLFLLVESEDPAIDELISAITLALQPPLSAPYAPEVMGLVARSVALVVSKLRQPRRAAIELESDLSTLHNLLTRVVDKGTCAAHLSLHGKASKHPVWVQLAKHAADIGPGTNDLRSIYIGCAVLLALHQKKPAPAVLVQHLREMNEAPLTEAAIESLLSGFVPTEHLSASWPSRFSRQWREVMKLFSDGDIPPPSLRDRITGQLLGAALNPSAAHSSGALDHRQLSPLQLENACRHIQKTTSEDRLEGILGILSVRTSLSLDLLAELPLCNIEAGFQSMLMDPLHGIVEIDLSVIVYEPARALEGCHQGGYRLRIHLPADAAKHLKARSMRFSGAACLRDLYPEDPVPESRHRIALGTDELEPTWARLRSTVGPHLLRNGTNGLLAALLTLDLSLICRSKLHYSVVPSREMHDAEAALYRALEWHAPVPLCSASGFGCRVVPLNSIIEQHDRSLRATVNALWPGQRSTVSSLVKHHNRYTELTGWRLSLLLALRASSRVSISAAVSHHDRWMPIHEKHTRADKGHQPVPLCPFARQTVALYKAHCLALGERVQKIESPQHPIARWSGAVAAGRNIRLLFIVDSKGRIRALPSIEFTRSTSSDYQLPEDPGRKFLENHLRWRGLPSTLIDQMLRHTHAGQVPLSSFHHQSLHTSMGRLSSAIESLATEFFKTPEAGLRIK